MRKNGTLTKIEQRKALANIKRELATVCAALDGFVAMHEAAGFGPISEAMGTAWNALNDAETALSREYGRVLLNSPASAIERMMANID